MNLRHQASHWRVRSRNMLFQWKWHNVLIYQFKWYSPLTRHTTGPGGWDKSIWKVRRSHRGLLHCYKSCVQGAMSDVLDFDIPSERQWVISAFRIAKVAMRRVPIWTNQWNVARRTPCEGLDTTEFLWWKYFSKRILLFINHMAFEQLSW